MSFPIIGTHLITTGSMSGSLETYTTLENGCFARRIGIGTDWTRIRIGIRFRAAFHPERVGVGSIVGTPRFAFGFCSGVNNILGDKVTDHFLGVASNGATWTSASTAGAGSLYWTSGAGTSTYQFWNVRAGSTNAVGIGTSIPLFFPTNTGSAQIQFFDYWKTSYVNGISSGSCKLFVRNSVTTGDEDEYVSDALFLNLLQSTAPALTGYSFASSTGLSINESLYGVLDSVCLWYDRNDPGFEIIDLYVIRLS